jgi:hypothetical protein
MEDTPHRTAAAFGLGLFIAFFPLVGIHTLLALGLAFLLRLSRAAVLLGAWMNNPWTIVPIYSAGTAVGCLLLGAPCADLGGLAWGEAGLLSRLQPYVWPFVVGNTVLGALVGGLGYLALRLALERRASRVRRGTTQA